MFTSAQVADRIKAFAKSKGLQVKDVLEKSDMSRTALGSMRAGSMPKADNLAKIAEQLGCSVDYLIGNTDDPTPPAERVALPEKEADRMVYEALKDTGLLGTDGLLSDQGAAVVARFLQQNADMLKKLMNP